MKILSIIAAVLISTTVLIASNEKAPTAATTSISGQVIDKVTGEALAGVKIELEKTVVYTDLDGNFEINNVVPGNYKLNTSLISYSTSNVEVDCSNKKEALEIKLDNK